MLNLKRIAPIFVVAAAIGLVTGCGGDTPPAPSLTAKESKTSSPSKTTDDPTETEKPTTEPGGLTAPGTELKVGESALIAVEDAKVKITVTELRQGTAEELATLDTQGEAEGKLPSYIQTHIEAVENGPSLAFKGWTGMFGHLADDSKAGRFTVLSDWPTCVTGKTFLKDAADGGSIDTCFSFLSPSATPVVTAKWAPVGTEYAKEPITWTN